MDPEHLRPMIINNPLENADQVRSAIRRPHGAMCFDMEFPEPLTPDLSGSFRGFPLVSGSIYFDVAFLPRLIVRFTHAAPGTGTRIADVNIASRAAAQRLRFIINWSPEETLLSIGEPGKPETWSETKGRESVETIQIGAGGVIVRLGGEGIQMMGATMYSEGSRVFGPPAINTWRDTLEAITIARRATSDEGFIYEIVSGNMCLAMLVTGYESYCKSRFLELEDEGLQPNYSALVNAFTSSAERDRGLPEVIEAEAQQNGISPIRHMVGKGRIDFQNYTQCKKAFKKAYGLRFGSDLGVDSATLELIQRLIRYRHRIVHISPMQTILNHPELPGGEPDMATRPFVDRAAATFDEFITALHSASLQLTAPGFSEQGEAG